MKERNPQTPNKHQSHCSVYIATSVDGFIATEDGGIEWLEKPEYSSTPINDLTYETYIKSIDAIIMGRKTFEKVRSFDSWPYEGTPVLVLSRTEIQIPPSLKDKVHRDAGDPHGIVKRLAEKGFHQLYIDGGLTIQQFLRHKLIDELIITCIPVLLGRGIPLFGNNGPELNLKLIHATSTDNGFVQVRYLVEKG